MTQPFRSGLVDPSRCRLRKITSRDCVDVMSLIGRGEAVSGCVIAVRCWLCDLPKNARYDGHLPNVSLEFFSQRLSTKGIDHLGQRILGHRPGHDSDRDVMQHGNRGAIECRGIRVI
jgi:hypothetical protein